MTTRTHFPTRQPMSEALTEGLLRARSFQADNDPGEGSKTFSTQGDGAADAADTAVLTRFVLGEDVMPMSMSKPDIEALGDAFTQRLLLREIVPRTVRELVDGISALPANMALPIRELFLVAEGGQIRIKEPSFELNARLVFCWRESNAVRPDILLSTAPAADNPKTLMQVIAWSNKDNAFHFFERDCQAGQWIWAGNSFHALAPASRGRGPFDSHINGGLVMKELKAPWSHWHSVSAGIAPDVLPAESELRSEPLFTPIHSAHKLEPIVQGGIRRWTRSRFQHHLTQGSLTHFPDYLRQILWCTSINPCRRQGASRQSRHPDGRTSCVERLKCQAFRTKVAQAMLWSDASS